MVTKWITRLNRLQPQVSSSEVSRTCAWNRLWSWLVRLCYRLPWGGCCRSRQSRSWSRCPWPLVALFSWVRRPETHRTHMPVCAISQECASPVIPRIANPDLRPACLGRRLDWVLYQVIAAAFQKWWLKLGQCAVGSNMVTFLTQQAVCSCSWRALS